MSSFFSLALLAGCLRMLALLVLRVSVALVVLLLIAGAAPAPAQNCTEATAPYLVRQQIERLQPSNGVQIAVPIGMAVAWSCSSRAEAEAELARQIAKIEQ